MLFLPAHQDHRRDRSRLCRFRGAHVAVDGLLMFVRRQQCGSILHGVSVVCSTKERSIDMSVTEVSPGCFAGDASPGSSRLLDRIDKHAADNPDCRTPAWDSVVESYRQRIERFGDGYVLLVTASYSELVEFAVSGELCRVAPAKQALTNPLFDADIAALIAESTNCRPSGFTSGVVQLLVGWAPDLLSVVRIYRATNADISRLSAKANAPPRVYRPRPTPLATHVDAAATDELIEALDSVRDSPEWSACLARESCRADLSEEVIGRFGWFGDDYADWPLLGMLTTDFLTRRFGDHVPTWQAFTSIAGPTTAIVDAAEIAAHVVPPSALP